MEGGAGSTFSLTAKAGGILYAVFTGTAADVALTVNGADAGTILSVEHSSGAVVDLGRVQAGQTVNLTLGAEVDNALFAILDEDAHRTACEEIRAAVPEVISWQDGAVVLQFDRDVDGLAVLTLPFNKNWQAMLDDTPVPVQETGYLLGVQIPAGSHTLSLRYLQPGLPAGLALSGIGLLLTLLLAFQPWKKAGRSRQNRKRE